MKIIKAIGFLILFLVMSCTSKETESSRINSKLITRYDYNQNELDLAKLINEYRKSIGLNDLELNNHLSYKSEEHNLYMIDNNVVNHAYFQERLENSINVLAAVKVDEIVAYNYVLPKGALTAWLISPSHKAAIEGDFTNFGIAISKSNKSGKNYYTVIFIKK
jgi:uncharacterized protein YkwD